MRPRRVAGATGAVIVSVLLGGAYLKVGLGNPSTCPMPEDRLGGFVQVEGGELVKGAAGIYPEEGRPEKVYVSSFVIGVHEVTNDQFAAFVSATGYVTDAETAGGSTQFGQTEMPAELSSWWHLERGVTWKSPEGAGSNLDGKGRHPVVHVTLRDARAYAAWAGGRIPTEVEWEYAASLGLFNPDDPESGARGPNGEVRANIWDGTFPSVNTREDGFVGTAPVGCFPPSLIGTHDMIGNVWEWTETRFGASSPRFTVKGGSYLCGGNYCRRYRPAARGNLDPAISTAHVGFRIVKDAEKHL